MPSDWNKHGCGRCQGLGASSAVGPSPLAASAAAAAGGAGFSAAAVPAETAACGGGGGASARAIAPWGAVCSTLCGARGGLFTGTVVASSVDAETASSGPLKSAAPTTLPKACQPPTATINANTARFFIAPLPFFRTRNRKRLARIIHRPIVTRSVSEGRTSSSPRLRFGLRLRSTAPDYQGDE